MNNVIKECREFKIDYEILCKSKDDILNELLIEEDEKLICDSIITNLERTASDNIRNGKCVSIPAIGCVRKDIVRNEIKTKKRNFSVIRKALTKEAYKEHIRSIVVDIKQRHEAKEKIKAQLFKIKRRNNKTYNKYAKRFGKTYADMYIYSLYLMKDVEFDIEWERHYQSLCDGEKSYYRFTNGKRYIEAGDDYDYYDCDSSN